MTPALGRKSEAADLMEKVPTDAERGLTTAPHAAGARKQGPFSPVEADVNPQQSYQLQVHRKHADLGHTVVLLSAVMHTRTTGQCVVLLHAGAVAPIGRQAPGEPMYQVGPLAAPHQPAEAQGIRWTQVRRPELTCLPNIR